MKKQLFKKNITFEPLASYFQNKNNILEQKNSTSMGMKKRTSFGGNFDDNLWLNIILAMTQI